MANEIDLIMTLDPLELTQNDIEKLVQYQRKMRLNHEAGIKPEKEGLAAVKGSALLDKLKLVKPVKVDRRF